MILEQLEYPFRFDASKCSSCAGNCCIGESGFIWITIDESEKLAIHLNVSVKEVFIKTSVVEPPTPPKVLGKIDLDMLNKPASHATVQPPAPAAPVW